MYWTTLERLSDSPALSHCNYHMLESLKKVLGSKRFGGDTNVEAIVRWKQALLLSTMTT